MYQQQPNQQYGGVYNSNYAPTPPSGYQSHHHQGPPPPPGYQSYNTYAPPQGPPQGYTTSQAPQAHPQKPQQVGFHPPATGFTALPQRFWLWTKSSSSTGETYVELGHQPNSEVLYSSKFSFSGRMKFKAGNYKSNGPLIGEADNKSIVSSKAVIKFNGYETELAKPVLSLGSASYSLEIPVNGRREVWEWLPNDNSLSAKLMKTKGWKLVRKGAESAPAVVFTDDAGSGFSSKTKMGSFEFVGQGATGELGDMFANIAVISLVKIKQMQFDKATTKAIMGAV